MINIGTYSELDRIAVVFAAGHYNLLILIGDPGLAKTSTTRKAIEDSGQSFLWLSGSVTGFQLYVDLYKHRDDKLLILDDVDNFYTDRPLVRLLKCLCETRETKTVAWHSAAAQLAQESIPNQFDVSMRVAIIANDLKKLNKNVGALQDRGQVFKFEPTAGEVHARAKTFFHDAEILGFVEQRLGLLGGKLSLRDYEKARENKAAGLDWQAMLLEDKEAPPEHIVMTRLLADPSLGEEERARRWAELTGKSRSTYFRHKQKLITPAA
jgi:hypothetical protein